MQLPDRRRPGGSRRWQSVRSILTRAFGSPFSDSLALAKVLTPPHLNGVSRRDGGATTAWFRLRAVGKKELRRRAARRGIAANDALAVELKPE